MPTVIVSHIVAIVLNEVLNDVTVVRTNGNRPFRSLLVLQWRLGVGTVSEVETFLIWIEITDVEGS
jgi:hypothetical protein